ncbi:MAG: APC family permease [Pseudorhodoplanes sp.]
MKPEDVTLRRRITLPMLVLYGVGVTIGAGIYVLIGATARHAGMHAPFAFLLAAVVMGLTAASYAELCTRLPVSAGEAAYVKAAFRSRTLTLLVGLLTAGIGIVSSATVALGAAGYLREFVGLPQVLLAAAVLVALGLVAVWGILESVLLAALFTLIELGGLVAIVVAGLHSGLDILAALPRFAVPPLELALWPGIAFASLLAFFAFIGFEDLVNIAEEAHAPERDMPWAIGLTLVISTMLYFLVAVVAVLAVPLERLAESPAPLSLVFRSLAGVDPGVISAVAVVATLNTVLVQLTMAARVLYGMARQGDLPRWLGQVNAVTATPLIATALVVAFALVLVAAFPLERLAEGTSLATLVVFAFINLALIRIRCAGTPLPPGAVRVPAAIPVLGLLTCLAMIAGSLL